MICFEDVAVGDVVPVFDLPLTVQRMVMEAAANRDYAPIHSDRELSIAAGAPDMFANVMFLQAIFEATLRTWMGSSGRLRRLAFDMQGFNLAGTVVEAEGVVSATKVIDDSGLIELDVWLGTRGARNAVGTAEVTLPMRAT